MENNMHPMPRRWTAVIYYRTDVGMIDHEFDFEEIADLDGYVERGPDWNTIDRIEVRLKRAIHPGLTIEQSLNQ